MHRFRTLEYPTSHDHLYFSVYTGAIRWALVYTKSVVDNYYIPCGRNTVANTLTRHTRGAWKKESWMHYRGIYSGFPVFWLAMFSMTWNKSAYELRITTFSSRPGGGTPWNFWWECAARISKSRPKNVVSHTRFQTWPQKSTPVFRPDIARNYA